MSYTCHAGLVDVVVPILVGDEKIGCFYSGQSLLSPPTPIGFQEIEKRVGELELDQETLWEVYQKVNQVDAYKLEMAVELLSIICSNLVREQIELDRQRKVTRSAVQRARLERDLREMELRLSQAQINPHFLFNSLNLILGEAMNENASRTAHLVEELSTLLSNSLTSIGSMVRLEAEIENARSYVGIFKARFGKKIDLRTDLPRTLASFKVPALMLQPLVENALVHAFPKCTEPFVVQIAASLSDESAASDRSGRCVEIRVSDNGPGMTSREHASVQRMLRARHNGKMTGLVGLSRRLRYYYADPPELHVEQSEAGLTVTIRLPGSRR
jgi:sensor histidine kinase YesM